jgi:hypothetical protein
MLYTTDVSCLVVALCFLATAPPLYTLHARPTIGLPVAEVSLGPHLNPLSLLYNVGPLLPIYTRLVC